MGHIHFLGIAYQQQLAYIPTNSCKQATVKCLLKSSVSQVSELVFNATAAEISRRAERSLHDTATTNMPPKLRPQLAPLEILRLDNNDQQGWIFWPANATDLKKPLVLFLPMSYFVNKKFVKSNITNNKLPFISDFRASLCFELCDLTNFLLTK